jgi:CRP-like cAMP-binding protein
MGAMGHDHPLVKAVGRESADMLHRSFAGETLPFPATRVRRFARYLAIAREFQQGIPIPVLAERHGVCLRTVERALDRVTHGDLSRAGGTPHPLPPGGLGSYPGAGVRV